MGTEGGSLRAATHEVLCHWRKQKTLVLRDVSLPHLPMTVMSWIENSKQTFSLNSSYSVLRDPLFLCEKQVGGRSICDPSVIY